MRRFSFLLFIMLGAMRIALAVPAQAPQAATPKPADCIADPKAAVASVEHGGKTYYFNHPACKDEFLTDPERYSQLYDALLELKAEGKPLQKSKPLDNASAVPS
ncbi:MAG: hypothetical protein M3347_17230 [Armatimonadota bacterium]|nr:hypothetical protein [Armatimonadota bacterium]